jgi:predicted transcriptional regulator
MYVTDTHGTARDTAKEAEKKGAETEEEPEETDEDELSKSATTHCDMQLIPPN